MSKKPSKTVIVRGKRYKYNCNCKVKSLDCITPEMWDASSSIRVTAKKVKK